LCAIKEKASNQPVGPSHSSGTSPYPFLTKRSCTHTDYTLELADTYFNDSNHSDANLHSDEEVFDVGCADSDADGSDNVVYFHHMTENTQGSDSMCNSDKFSTIIPHEDAILPYNPDISLPPTKPS
jgi:hypothetical protein